MDKALIAAERGAEQQANTQELQCSCAHFSQYEHQPQLNKGFWINSFYSNPDPLVTVNMEILSILF